MKRYSVWIEVIASLRVEVYAEDKEEAAKQAHASAKMRPLLYSAQDGIEVMDVDILPDVPEIEDVDRG